MAAVSCTSADGGKGTLALVVEVEGDVEADALRVWIKSEQGAVRRVETPDGDPIVVPLAAGDDLGARPYRIALEVGDRKGMLIVHVAAIERGELRAVADGSMELMGTPVTLKMPLRVWQGSCDLDEDSFLDCNRPQCCNGLSASLKGVVSDCVDDPARVADLQRSGGCTPGVDGFAMARSAHPFRPASFDTAGLRCGDCIDQDCRGGDASCASPAPGSAPVNGGDPGPTDAEGEGGEPPSNGPDVPEREDEEADAGAGQGEGEDDEDELVCDDGFDWVDGACLRQTDAGEDPVDEVSEGEGEGPMPVACVDTLGCLDRRRPRDCTGVWRCDVDRQREADVRELNGCSYTCVANVLRCGPDRPPCPDGDLCHYCGPECAPGEGICVADAQAWSCKEANPSACWDLPAPACQGSWICVEGRCEYDCRGNFDGDCHPRNCGPDEECVGNRDWKQCVDCQRVAWDCGYWRGDFRRRALRACDYDGPCLCVPSRDDCQPSP